MAIAEVAPGDEIDVTLVSRLYAGSVEDVQWADFKYRCNLLGEQWCEGGPDDQHWVNTKADFINPKRGAEALALDLREPQNYGEHPDWVHKFTYQVPIDLESDLKISAKDTGRLRLLKEGSWHEASGSASGRDRLVLPLKRL